MDDAVEGVPEEGVLFLHLIQPLQLTGHIFVELGIDGFLGIKICILETLI